MSIDRFVPTNGSELYSSKVILITPEQLAKLLQISKRSLWRLRASGQLPAPVQLRKSVRWRATDIEQWLARGCPQQVQ